MLMRWTAMTRSIVYVTLAVSASGLGAAHAAVLCKSGNKVRVRLACKGKQQIEKLAPESLPALPVLPALPTPPVCQPGEGLRWTGSEFACVAVVASGSLDCRGNIYFTTLQLDDAIEHEVTSINCPAGTEVAGGGFEPRSSLPGDFAWLWSKKAFNQRHWSCGFSAHAPGVTVEVGCQVICCTVGAYPSPAN